MSPVIQQTIDHMQVFKLVLDCLMSSRFESCLLLYVIQLAGWLKRCNLSLSRCEQDRGQGALNNDVKLQAPA